MDLHIISDEQIGSGEVDISKYRGQPQEQQVIVNITFGGINVGKVTIGIRDFGHQQVGGQFGVQQNQLGVNTNFGGQGQQGQAQLGQGQLAQGQQGKYQQGQG